MFHVFRSTILKFLTHTKNTHEESTLCTQEQLPVDSCTVAIYVSSADACFPLTAALQVPVMIEILPLPACPPCFRHPGCHPCGQGRGGGGGGVVVTLHDAGCNKSSLGKASKKKSIFLGKSPKLWVGGGQES